jgi:tetratricopeptide (TPR) repeat protein
MKKIIMLASIAVLVTACVTEKKRKDVSKTKKFYHDITAEFNGYFNATELYNASVTTLSDQEPENYGKLLPIYPYVAVENPAVVAADMDEAIKKVTIVAALHDPSHWVDDCYLMAGKAQYLKQDYESAEETLEYLVREFSPEALLADKKKKDKAKPKTKKERQKVSKERAKERNEDKKEREKTAAQKRKEYKKRRKQKNKEIARRRKAKMKGKTVPKQPEEVAEVPAPAVEIPKEDNKEEVAEENNDIKLDEPDGLFKHKSAHQAGQLWLARTYIQRDKHEQAAYLLRQLKNKDKLYEDVARELPVVEAHLAFVQKRYNDAMPSLEQAVAVAEEKEDRARYTYILAQLQEQNGNNAAAYALYEEVVKMRPEYEMEFSALMSMLLNEYNSGSSGREETIKSLERLTKDEKNVDYLDRIYFAIAEIHLQSGNETEGVKYLELALKQGTTNPAQQAESFLKLANVYYEKDEFVKASEYYGQSISGIAKSDDRYEEIEKRSRVLGEIASRINKVTLQDSLIRVGNMTPDEKRALAFEIKKKQDEERRQQAIASAKEQDSQPARRPRVTAAGNPSAASPKSNYWAYDDRGVKRGKRDFSRQWGTRPLTDDWRRSNAQQVGDLATEEEDLDLDNSGLLSDDQVANILRGVPQSKSQLQSAEADKYLAMFELGVLYRKDLERLDKAILTLEQLLREYPTTEKKAETYYHLYLAHKDSGNNSNAQRYLERLKAEFPESPFTQILSDPNYADKINDEKQQLDRFYTETYQLFTDEKYQEAHNRIQQVPSKFGEDNELKARFALLEAMTTGNLQGREAYIRKLREVITKHANTDEQKRAREILLLLGERSGSPLPGGGNDVADNSSEFKYEPEKLHYLLIALDPDAALTDAKVKVADFNRKFHASDRLSLSNIYLTPNDADRVPLLIIRRFKDGAAAMQYYKNVQLNAADFLTDSDYLVYPVTQQNYRQIIRSKSLDNYDSFFEQNYLQNK